MEEEEKGEAEGRWVGWEEDRKTVREVKLRDGEERRRRGEE